MNIYRNFDSSNYNPDSIVTVGTFDGVHLGHREIIQFLNSLKNKREQRSVILTFEPHPQLVLKNKGREIKLLSSASEKIDAFESLGVDAVFITEFTNEFASTSAEDFLKKYLINGTGLSHLVLGYDHNFGRNREGNYDMLNSLSGRYGFKLHKVDELKIGSDRVNSTTIRHLLENGEVERAAVLLGYNYGFSGKVVVGDRRGSTIGFPTVNIEITDPHKQIPKNGVYFVKVRTKEGSYYGMMNIGLRPTVSDSGNIFIEANLFDFNKNIYGEEIKVSFLKYIREEKKFSSLDELVKQLNIDRETCRNILANN